MPEKFDDNQRENRDDLEYNDGLGDLLREKEQFEFSWVKTLASVFIIILVLYICVTLLFKLAKSMVETPSATTAQAVTPISSTQEELVDEILATSSLTVTTLPTANMGSSKNVVKVIPAQRLPIKPLPQPSPAPVEPVRVVSRPEPKKAFTPAFTPAPIRSLTKEKVKEQRKPIRRPEPFVPKLSEPPSGQTFRVIAGSFISRKNADILKAQLASKGVETYIWATSGNENETVYRVQVGSFKNNEVARQLQAELNRKGIETYIQSN